MHRRALLACAYAFLFIPLVVLPWNFYPFATGKAVALRILGAICLFLWSIKPSFPRHPIAWATLAVLALTGVSTLGASDPYLAFYSSPSRQEGFANMLALGMVFLVVVAARPNWRVYFAVAVGVAVFDALVGISFHYVYLATQETRAPKVHSLTGNAAYLGLYLAMTLTITLWLWIGAKEKLMPREGWPYLSPLNTASVVLWPWAIPTKIGAWAMILAALIQFHALTLTQSRGAVLALAAGIATGSVSLLKFRWRYKGPVLGAIALAGLILVLSTLPWYAGSIHQRMALWEVCWRMAIERPLFGWGPDGLFQGFINRVAPESGIADMPFDRAHNWVLERLVMSGAPGLLAYLWLLWAMFRTGIDPMPKAVLACYLVGNLFFFDVMETSILFVALAACLVSRDIAQDAVVVADGQPTLDGGVRTGRT